MHPYNKQLLLATVDAVGQEHLRRLGKEEVMSEEQKDKAIELGQIIFTNTINNLEQQLAAAQARIAELTEFIKAHTPHLDEGPECTYCNLFLGNDDLSALEAAKVQARREALMEVLSGLEDGTDWHDVADIAAWVRCMAEEVK